MLYRFIHTAQIPSSAFIFKAGEIVDSAKIPGGYLPGWIKGGIVVPADPTPNPEPPHQHPTGQQIAAEAQQLATDAAAMAAGS